MISTLDDRADEVNMLVLARQEYDDPQMCHRLDKETSGALLIAKNPEAYRNAAIQFEKRQVNKVYHAAVDGIHDFNAQELNLALEVTGRGHVRPNFRSGKEAITVFSTVKAYKRHSLIECRPLTGRMHQIRVHLSHLGASIINDEIYGGQLLYLSSLKKNYNLKQWTEERPLINRFALHAFQIEFRGLENEIISVEAPYPKDFRVLVQKLEKNC